MDRAAWQATVRGFAKSWTRLSNYHSLSLSLYVVWQFLVFCIFRTNTKLNPMLNYMNEAQHS